MFDFNEKRKIRNLVYSKISIGIVLILSGILGVSVFERFQVSEEMTEKKNSAVQELELLEQQAKALEEKVENLQNERGIEEELRKRFDVVKEGEQMIVIVDDKNDQNIEKENFGEDIEQKNFLDILKFW